MRSALPLGTYLPGATIWHRLPVGPKLVGLLAASLIVVWLRGPTPTIGALGLALVVAFWAGVPARVIGRGLRPVLLVVGVLGTFQWVARGWPTALELVATVLTLVVAATAFTATTPMDDLLDAIVRWLGPFRRVGVRPEAVALAFSLTLTAIPTVFTILVETRDAARARGLGRSPRAILAPTAIRVVAHARATGEALAARGLGDDPTPRSPGDAP